MAKTVNLPRGTSLSSSKSPKRNKQGNNDNHDDGNKRTPKKSKKDGANSKIDDTMSKTNAETLILTKTNANENVETHSGSPIRSGDERSIKEKELSLKNKEAEGSNMEFLESTVCNKNNIFHFGKYCLY